MSDTNVTFMPPFAWCKTEFNVSTSSKNIRDEGCHATLVIRTGAVSLQTYATREELRALAAALLEAAEEDA